ncbi:MAG: rane fusion protein multidrug efflux system, partial [Pseudomonadota bacterium]|nr:rane fusion protein multidrug efflux system [Pseudomonadota bacterium]
MSITTASMKIIHFPTLVILLAMLQACSGDSPPGNQGKSAAQYASSAAVELREQSTSETIAGTLQARRTARIHNQQAGVVSRIHAFTGDRVKQGALLAQLDDKLLAAQRDKANAALEQARLDMHRAEALSKNNLIAEDALARARTAVAMTQADANLAQAQFDYSRIIAPFDGIISERLVDEGDVVANQTHIFTL